MATTRNALWPTITTRDGAVGAALVSAATTLSWALLYFPLQQEVIAEYGTVALFEPALFGVIAWRTWRLSRAWSLVGVMLSSLAVAESLFTAPSTAAYAVFALFGMLTGYRGSRAARRFTQELNTRPERVGV